jgi:hypothetical protein
VGIEGRNVYSVVHEGLCLLVHDCLAEPYLSRDAQVVDSWVLAHHGVVEAGWKRWGSVLPMAFNTIVQEDERSVRQNLVRWVDAEQESLRARLKALAGRAEYGVQVFWDRKQVIRRVGEDSAEIANLEEAIRSKPPGVAYMYRQRVEDLLRREIERRAAAEFGVLFERLHRCVDEVRVERPKEGENGRQMLVNLSCLVSPKRQPELEAELADIMATDGYFVRLAGPMPPYSFCQQ